MIASFVFHSTSLKLSMRVNTLIAVLVGTEVEVYESVGSHNVYGLLDTQIQY
jgi:hypothetical protein